MEQDIFLSVCIPLYNSGGFICEALDSIDRQTCKGQIEVVVVDDCSTDDSYQRVCAYRTTHQLQIRLYKNDANSGGGYTRNRACAEARGKYVLFLDHDDALFPGSLDELYARFCDEDFDMIVGGYAGADDRLVPRRSYLNPEQRTTGLEAALELSRYRFEIRTGSYLVKRSVIEKNQILEQSGNLFGCDQKINYLCLLHSAQIAVTQVPLYVYRTAPGSEMTSAPTLKRYEQCQIRQELLQYLRRHFPRETELAQRFEFVLIPEAVVAITRVFYYTDFDKKELTAFLRRSGYAEIQRQTLRNRTIGFSFRLEAFLQLYAKPVYRCACWLRRKGKR